MPKAHDGTSLPGSAPTPPIRRLTALAALTALLLAPSASVLAPGALGAGPAPRGAPARDRGAPRATVLLGGTSVGTRHDSLRAGRGAAFRLHARAPGLATTLRIFLDARSTARSVLVGIYRDTRRHPGALLATGSLSSLRAGAWNAVALTPSRLVSGRAYWLVVLGKGGTLRYRSRRHGRCASETSVHANLGALPLAWRSGRSSGRAGRSGAHLGRHGAHCPISAYATAGTPGAAPVNLAPPLIVASPPGPTTLLSPGLALGQISPVLTPPKEGRRTPPAEAEPTPPGSEEQPPPTEEEHPRRPAAPSDSLLPTIGGVLTEGDILSSTRGTWIGSPTSYAYQWQDCNAAGASCTAIAGATSSHYTLTATDVGQTLRVVVTATNEGGATPATSTHTAIVAAAPPPPPPAAPTNTKAPTISGTTTQGQALDATKGSWSGTPTSYAYQWQDCDAAGTSCANVAGATASSYTLAESDVGHTLRVVVTATNEGGSTPATSAQTAIVAAYSSGSPYPECTQTIGQGANVPGTVSGASSGSVICLSSGAYGSLALNSAHAGDVTLQAAPGAHVSTGSITISGSHVVVRGLWVDGEVALEEGASFITIDRDDITNEGEHGGEGVVFDTSDCTAPNAPKWAGCEPHAPITDITISHNHFHNIGQGNSEDAIHLDNWRNVTVTGNEFDHIIESGNHTDCLQSVYGGSNLVFDHNYEHDNDCQGIFIKDGDATNVSITDNLFLRDHANQYENFAQIWNVEGLTMQHNTIWDGKGLALVTEEASFTPTATINHNVISNIVNEPHTGNPYTITEGDNVFGQSPWSFSARASDRAIRHPRFADPARDDYRLAHNRRGIGIDWSPAAQQYGPAS